jgi:hypothetical protein
MELRLDNLLDFPFRFAIDNVWCGSLVVGAMCLSFTIMGEEINVKMGWIFMDVGRVR